MRSPTAVLGDSHDEEGISGLIELLETTVAGELKEFGWHDSYTVQQ